MFTAADVISIYTRAQAIDDGALIDVSEFASTRGFKMPVCVTHAVHFLCVEVAGDEEASNERLSDVLMMAHMAAKGAQENADRVYFKVLATPRSDHRDGEAVEHDLIMHIGPGDSMEPVLTIMTPEDD